MLKQHRGAIEISNTIALYQAHIGQLNDLLDRCIASSELAAIGVRAQTLADKGMPEQLAAELARLDYRTAMLEIAGISIKRKSEIEVTACVYFQLAEILGLNWIAESIERLAVDNQWHERARFALMTDLTVNHAAITHRVLGGHKGKDAAEQVSRWIDAHQLEVDNIQRTADQLRAQDAPDFAMISVLMSGLSHLA